MSTDQPLGTETSSASRSTTATAPFYAQVRRNAVAFNLRRTETWPWAGDPAEEELLAARLEVDDAKSLFLELRDGGAPIHQGLRTEPWGQVTFVVRDPDGNLISFGSPMPLTIPNR